MSHSSVFPFPKHKRLCSKKLIERLFSEGSSFFAHPIKMVWLDIPMEEKLWHPDNVQILISVPKKLFKRAVDRNVIKRRIRESFRLHQTQIQTTPGFFRLYAFICVAKQTPSSFSEIDHSLQHLLSKDKTTH